MQQQSLDDNYVWTITNVIPEQECKHLIQLSEHLGYEKAGLRTGHLNIIASDVRNNSSVSWHDCETASLLWNKISFSVPRIASDLKTCTVSGECFQVVGLNPHFKFYKYEPGQYFTPHKDSHVSTPLRPATQSEVGRFNQNPSSESNKFHSDTTLDTDMIWMIEERSFLTCLFYLNSITETNGGETNFLEFQDDNPQNEPKLRFSVKPTEGSALLFVHRQWHEGVALQLKTNDSNAKLSQSVKYVLRTDVMYKRIFQMKNVMTTSNKQQHIATNEASSSCHIL